MTIRYRLRQGRRWAATLVALSVVLGGCWDHQPPEDTAFILTIGIDMDPNEPRQHVVTQMAVLPTGLTATGEQGGETKGTPFYLLSNTAHTLEGAQLAVVDHLSRLPRLDHLDALVLGEDFAHRGEAVEPTIAWVLRHPQIRPGVLLFVAEGSAQEFMDARPALDPLPGAALAGLMRHVNRVPFVIPVRAYEFARSVMSPRMDGVIPIVRRINPLAVQVPPDFEQQPFVGSGEGGGGGGSSEPMNTQIQLVGMAIFKGASMVGSLMREDGKGLTWIEGNSKVGISIPHPEDPNTFIAAVAIRTSAKRTARLQNDRVLLSIEIDSSMDVWGEGMLEPMGISRYKKAIEQGLSETIAKQARTTMQALQELEADIFGFGEELYRSAPKDWDKVSDKWDQLYRDAELDVKVKVKVRRTGLSR